MVREMCAYILYIYAFRHKNSHMNTYRRYVHSVKCICTLAYTHTYIYTYITILRILDYENLLFNYAYEYEFLYFSKYYILLFTDLLKYMLTSIQTNV